MRQASGILAAVLVLSLLGPAFGQPFSDTPPNHWAYDAIAELAAKGLVEGYPDGTFKGDRAMTRYEMAMVVARLLARIESIQVPPAGPAAAPEVTRQDIDNITRLVEEFRAELAAQNVRLTAVEEELNAIKASLDNVHVSGAVRYRIDVQGSPSGAALNGNPRTGKVAATNGNGVSPGPNRDREAFRLQFDGSVSPDVHFIADIMTNNFFVFNSGLFAPASPTAPSTSTVDDAFFDWRNAFGWPLEVWLGRFGGGGNGTQIGKTYPVVFGPFGLLLNTTLDTWDDTTNDSNFNVADGLRLAAHLPQLADLQVQGVIIRINGGGGSNYASGEDAFGVDANLKVAEGVRFGGYYVGNSINQFGLAPFSQPAGALSFLYHVYGPAANSVDPSTSHCPTAVGAKGITCPAAGNGFGAYVQWNIVNGVHLDGEWAQWNDSVLGGSDNGYNAVVTWNLGKLLGVGHNLILTTGYANYGANFYAPYGGADLDPWGWDYIYPGDAQGFTATASFSPWQGVTLYGDYLTGSTVSNAMTLDEFEVGVSYAFAPNAKITVKYRDLSMGGVDQYNLYRAQVDFSF